jgi:hypothetical protein
MNTGINTATVTTSGTATVGSRRIGRLAAAIAVAARCPPSD